MKCLQSFLTFHLPPSDKLKFQLKLVVCLKFPEFYVKILSFAWNARQGRLLSTFRWFLRWEAAGYQKSNDFSTVWWVIFSTNKSTFRSLVCRDICAFSKNRKIWKCCLASIRSLEEINFPSDLFYRSCLSWKNFPLFAGFSISITFSSF